MQNKFTPKEIVKMLDKYIISQDEAKQNVAVSLRNRYRRKMISDDRLQEEIMPKNIILIGPTGVGKTEIARRLATITKSPFIKVEATKYTEVGYVGKDVESMVKDLVSLTYRMVKDEIVERLKGKYIEKVYSDIAKKISPYLSIDDEEFQALIEEVKSGKHDEKEIEVEISNQQISPVIEVYSNGPDVSEGLNGVQGMLDEMMSSISGNGKKKKEKIMKVENAINYLIKKEVEENLDRDDIIPEVIDRVEQDGIIFIDEIDKIAEREGNSRGEVSRQGVQRDILPIVEGTTIMTKHGPVRTDHILFIAAGAFSMAKPSDLMPELQGRFPVRVNLKSLKKDDFVKILTSVDYNLLIQYKSLLEVDGVNLSFTEDAIDKIAEYAILMNDEVENIGARRLASIIEEVLREFMYEAPYEEIKELKITAEYIDSKLEKNKVQENLEDYIL